MGRTVSRPGLVEAWPLTLTSARVLVLPDTVDAPWVDTFFESHVGLCE